MGDETHACVFVEEQGDMTGALALGPCLTCGLPAMDALEQLRSELAAKDKVIGQIRALHPTSRVHNPPWMGPEAYREICHAHGSDCETARLLSSLPSSEMADG